MFIFALGLSAALAAPVDCVTLADTLSEAPDAETRSRLLAEARERHADDPVALAQLGSLDAPLRLADAFPPGGLRRAVFMSCMDLDGAEPLDEASTGANAQPAMDETPALEAEDRLSRVSLLDLRGGASAMAPDPRRWVVVDSQGRLYNAKQLATAFDDQVVLSDIRTRQRRRAGAGVIALASGALMMGVAFGLESAVPDDGSARSDATHMVTNTLFVTSLSCGALSVPLAVSAVFPSHRPISKYYSANEIDERTGGGTPP